MCAFEEYPRKKIKYEVCRRYLRCAREFGESISGLNVHKRSFWSFKGALWRIEVYDAKKCIVFRL
jgi:hypothetical protein